MTNLTKPINLSQPADYLIEVQGRLNSAWSSSFEGMTMTAQTSVGGFSITILRGNVADQSTLHGMLNHIRDLGLPLLKVECISLTEEKAIGE